VTARPYLLAECTWPMVRAAKFETAILPWGATEAHNLHLPYATDTIQSEAVAVEAARQAWDRGARVVVLPALPFGVQTGQREIPLCLNLNPSTQQAILRDLCGDLARHGITRLVILNGHGGNDFRQIIRELQPSAGLLLSQVNWWSCLPAAEYFDVPGDHAGELETSVVQHLRPDLVRPLAEAGPGQLHRFTVRGFREGWAWTPRHWVRATDDTGVGDPAAATAVKGARFFEAVSAQVAGFLVELAGTPEEELYER
jgi:creatinine amidohydrolase